MKYEKGKWYHVANMFYEEYLEYEFIITFQIKDFEEKHSIG